MGEVKIAYDGYSYEVNIEDISPENLQESFNLASQPEYLIDNVAKKIISSKNWKSKLNVGSTYHIKGDTSVTSGNGNVDEEDRKKSTSGIDDEFRGIVLHSLIASTAVYNIHHNDDDKKLIEQYLNEQMNNHFFDYVIPSKNGDNFFLIAKETNVNRIYVAFRGNKDLMDWKYNLQVTFR